MQLISATVFYQHSCFDTTFFSQSFMVSESRVLQKETPMPLYVAPEDEQLLYMYEEVKQAAASRNLSIFIRGMMRSRKPCMDTMRDKKNKYNSGSFYLNSMLLQFFAVWSQLQPFRSW